MKKKLLVLGIMLLVISGCSALTVEKPVEYVKANEVMTRFENKDTFAFVIGDEKCPACNVFMKGAQSELLKEEDVKLNYIDMDKLNEKEYNELAKLVQDYLSDEFEATPTTYFVVDGKVEDIIVGAAEYAELSETYNKHITK